MSVSRLTNAPSEGLTLGVKTKKAFMIVGASTAFTSGDLPPVLKCTGAANLTISVPAPDAGNEGQFLELYAPASNTVAFQSPAGTLIGAAAQVAATKGEYQVQNGTWVRLV